MSPRNMRACRWMQGDPDAGERPNEHRLRCCVPAESCVRMDAVAKEASFVDLMGFRERQLRR